MCIFLFEKEISGADPQEIAFQVMSQLPDVQNLNKDIFEVRNVYVQWIQVNTWILLLLNSIVACLWYKNMNFFVMSVLTDFLFSLPTIQCLHDHIFCTFTPTSDLHVVHSVNEPKFLKYQNFMNQIILLWNFGEVSNI